MFNGTSQSMLISVLSDTHGFINDQLLSLLKSSDEIWHAGDIGNMEVIDQLSTVPGKLRMVYGNIDDSSIRTITPEYLFFEVQRMKILITHIADNPTKYNSTTRSLIAEHKPDILIAGHSHILKVINDKENNLLFINPGACGQHGFHKMRTIIQFEIDNGKPQNLRVVELGQRGQLNK